MTPAFRRGCLLVFAAALAVRLACVAVTGRGEGELVMDAADYHGYAVHLVNEGRFADDAGEVATRMPGYPLFLAAVYKTLGFGVLKVQAVQALLGAAACVLLALAALPMLGPAWALAAGGIGAVYYDLWTGTPRVLTETLYIFALSLFFLAWSRRERFGPAFTAAAGAALAACALIKPEAALVAGAAGLLLLLGGPFRTSFFRALSFSLGFWLLLGPWIVRNHSVLGAWLPGTSKAGFNSYVGLRYSLEKVGLAKGPGFEAPPGPELERDRAYAAAAREVYRATPWKDILKTMAFNALVLAYPFHPAYDGTLVFFLPFFLLGACLAVREPDGRMLLAFLGVSVFVYVFLGSTISRYREALAPALVVLAALGLRRFHEKVPPAVFLRACGVWAGLNLAVWAAAPQVRQMMLHGKAALW